MNSANKELDNLFERERIIKLISAELNNFVGLKPFLSTIIKHIQSLTGSEAVCIRLHDQGDYPYFAYNGIPQSFIKKENSLCARDKNRDKIRSSEGKGYLLECLCGNIIRGRFDSSLPFFTKNGSFFSNNISVLRASLSKKTWQNFITQHCNLCKYKSVALIPIIARRERIGLIQLNDVREGMFTQDLIEYIEIIGELIGLAVQNNLLQELNNELKAGIEKQTASLILFNEELRQNVIILKRALSHLLKNQTIDTPFFSGLM